MQSEDYLFVNGVYMSKANSIDTSFEASYLAARKKEGRLYDDVTVKTLPDISLAHPFYNEWMIRKESAERLIRYFKKKAFKTILEVGCGNGWLSNLLADNLLADIVAADVNRTELEQAARLFKKENLVFMYDEFTSPHFLKEKFDAIIFAASVQYFPSLKDVISIAINKLNANGEIHLVDSFFYQPEEIANAKERTKIYYEQLGFPEMAESYFHHCIKELDGYNYQFLYKPAAFLNKLRRNRNPFPWIVIKHA